ncbi:MAG: anti-sigma factor domain-containing protein [Bacteroidia bacterium]
MKRSNLFGTIALAAVMIFSSCSKEEELATSPELSDNELVRKGKKKIEYNINGLEPLGSDYRYEGWIIVNGSPVSTGTFKVTPSGNIAPPIGIVNANDLAAATAFVLTIEPHPDPNPAPSNHKILAGDFSGNTATITVGHPAALGNSFMSAMGKFILATPTTATMADEKSGAWFIDVSSGSPMAGLDLPTLPSGWIYEGWAVINGIPVTTGKFMQENMADMAAPFSGPLPGPPFPGEDLIMNAPSGLSFPTNLSGSKIVVTIEPYPDNSPMPFFLKPLAGDVPANAMDHTTYPLMNISSMFPSGTVIR